MTRSLRVVLPTDGAALGEPVTMAEAIVALAARVAADNPTLAMVVWEHPAGKLNVRTLPDSLYVAEILALRVKEMLHGEGDAE